MIVLHTIQNGMVSDVSMLRTDHLKCKKPCTLKKAQGLSTI